MALTKARLVCLAEYAGLGRLGVFRFSSGVFKSDAVYIRLRRTWQSVVKSGAQKAM